MAELLRSKNHISDGKSEALRLLRRKRLLFIGRSRDCNLKLVDGWIDKISSFKGIIKVREILDLSVVEGQKISQDIKIKRKNDIIIVYRKCEWAGKFNKRK